MTLALHPDDPIELKRRVIAPPPPPPPPPPPDRITQLQRIRNALAAEIARLRHDGGSDARASSSSGSAISSCSQSGTGRPCSTPSSRSRRASPRRSTRSPARSRSSATPTTRRCTPRAFRRITNSRSSAPRRSPTLLKQGCRRSGPRRHRRQGAGRADRQQHDAGRARQEPPRRNLHRAQRVARYAGSKPDG